MGLYLLGILAEFSNSFLGVYLMFFGALPIAGVRLYNLSVASEERRRINTILLFSSFFLLGASISLYLDKKFWIVLILMAAVLDGYSSYRKIS